MCAGLVLAFLGMARQIVLLLDPSNLDLSITARIMLQFWLEGWLLTCCWFVLHYLRGP